VTASLKARTSREVIFLPNSSLHDSYFFNTFQILSTMSTAARDPVMPPSEQFEVISSPKVDEPEKAEAAPEDHPTESHELANADHEEKGAAQMDHGQTEVRDLGWNEDAADVPQLVGGLPNEELWTLIRRFNKVGSIHSAMYV
jgi:Protein of unknown function (DUF3292)